MPKRGIKIVYRKPNGKFASPSPYLSQEKYGYVGKRVWFISRAPPKLKPPRKPPPIPKPVPEAEWIVSISYYKSGKKEKTITSFKIIGARPTKADTDTLIECLGPKTFQHAVDSIKLVK